MQSICHTRNRSCSDFRVPMILDTDSHASTLLMFSLASTNALHTFELGHNTGICLNDLCSFGKKLDIWIETWDWYTPQMVATKLVISSTRALPLVVLPHPGLHSLVLVRYHWHLNCQSWHFQLKRPLHRNVPIVLLPSCDFIWKEKCTIFGQGCGQLETVCLLGDRTRLVTARHWGAIGIRDWSAAWELRGGVIEVWPDSVFAKGHLDRAPEQLPSNILRRSDYLKMN